MQVNWLDLDIYKISDIDFKNKMTWVWTTLKFLAWTTLIKTYFIRDLAFTADKDDYYRGSKRRKRDQSRKEMRRLGYDEDQYVPHKR